VPDKGVNWKNNGYARIGACAVVRFWKNVLGSGSRLLPLLGEGNRRLDDGGLEGYAFVEGAQV